MPSFSSSETFTGNSLGFTDDPSVIADGIPYQIQDIAVSPNGLLAINADYTETSRMYVFDGETGTPVALAEHPYFGTAVAIDDDGNPAFDKGNPNRSPALYMAGKRESLTGMTITRLVNTNIAPDYLLSKYGRPFAGASLGPDWIWRQKVNSYTAGKTIVGLAVRNKFYYASDSTSFCIWVFSSAEPTGYATFVTTIPFSNPGKLAVTIDNQWAWVIQLLNGSYRVVKLGISPQNVGVVARLIQQSLWNPTSVAIDANNRLLIADNGPLKQVHIYDQDGFYLNSFGSPYGVFSGHSSVRGSYRPAAFISLEGIAVDKSNNLYVLNNTHWPGRASNIEAYAPQGDSWKAEFKWTLNGQRGSALPVFDPRDPSRLIIGPVEGLVDHTKPSQSSWRLLSFPNYLSHPNFSDTKTADKEFPRPTQIVYIQNKRFIVHKDLFGRLSLFRPDSSLPTLTHHCYHFFRHQAWHDANGDGLIKDSEVFTPPWAGWASTLFELSFDILSDGSLVRFAGTTPEGLHFQRFLCKGLDARQIPVWDTTPQSVYVPHSRPGEGSVYDWRFDIPTSSVYVHGRALGTSDYYLSRYQGIAGKANLLWRVPMAKFVVYNRDPYRWSGGGLFDPDSPMNGFVSFDIAGDYVFLLRNTGLRVAVLTASDGKQVYELKSKFAPSIWVDLPWSLRAVKFSSSFYRVAVNNNYHNNTLLYNLRVRQ